MPWPRGRTSDPWLSTELPFRTPSSQTPSETQANSHDGEDQSPRAPLFLWPGPWKGRQVPQSLRTLSTPATAEKGTLSSCLIWAQG